LTNFCHQGQTWMPCQAVQMHVINWHHSTIME
jgi:hypothetical protein